MAYFYTNPESASDEHALPDAETVELTAEEVAVMDEYAVRETGRRFPLMHMNSREHERAIAWLIDEFGIEGGWFYWYCAPGASPMGSPMGPFDTEQEARAAAIAAAAE